MIIYDYLRHFFAVCVIVIHMTSSQFSEEFNVVVRDAGGYVDGCVFGFFLISGFFFRPPGSFKKLCESGLKRLIVPYVLFSIAYGLILVFLGLANIDELFFKILTGRGGAMQLYFLPFLFVVQIFFGFLEIKVKANILVFLQVFFTLQFFGLSLIFPTSGSTGGDYLLLYMYSLCFLVGRVLKFLEGRKRKSMFLGALLLLVIPVGCFDPRYLDVGFVLALFLIVQFLQDWLPDARLPGSGGVYLLHTPILNFAILAVLLKFDFPEWLVLSLTIVLTYLLAVLFTRWVAWVAPEAKWILLE
ncbi:acyltransferase family protein [Roseibacillus persicicus]|uniref:acyltransferase family protein n=1 Tax=Roseibacillus persicicus TaxID=454148 RepID=UPI00398BA7ED